MSKIRSSYIEELARDKSKLTEKLEESTLKTIQAVFNSSFSKSITNMINEADELDGSEEEDGLSDTQTLDNGEEIVNVDDEQSANRMTLNDGLVDDEVETVEVPNDDEKIWDELEQYRNQETDEYDLTTLDDENLLRVFKVIKPEDGVKVVEKDGTLEFTDGEDEFVIELESEDNQPEKVGLEETQMIETNKDKKRIKRGWPFDVEELETIPDKAVKSDYLVEEDDFEFEIIPDGNEDIDDEDFEIEIEESMTVSNGVQAHSTAKSHGTNNLTRSVAKNGSVAGVKVKSTSDAMYEAKLKALSEQLKEARKENRQLKMISNKFKEFANEATLVTENLANTVNLFVKNATSTEEKKNIIERFQKVKSTEESKALYETINEELKRAPKTKSTIKESYDVVGTNKLNESAKVDSSLSRVQSLMKRLSDR